MRNLSYYILFYILSQKIYTSIKIIILVDKNKGEVSLGKKKAGGGSHTFTLSPAYTFLSYLGHKSIILVFP